MPGHRVAANITLLPTGQGGLRSTIGEGNKSLIYIFESSTGRDDETPRFGGVIDRIRTGCGEPGRSLEADLWFWLDQAAEYATVGITFQLWYAGRIVGKGKVIAELD